MPFRRILVPVDFGESMQPALDLAIPMARASAARVTLLHVFDIAYWVSLSPFVTLVDATPILEALDHDLKAVRERLQPDWQDVDTCVRQGNVPEIIVLAARLQECDLIVMGTHGRRGLSRALLGSVAEKVVRLSPVPVLTVHPDTAREARHPAGQRAPFAP